MLVKEFIKVILVAEIKDIQQVGGHHYLSFSLIAQGIEFLGACLDDEDFSVERQSRKRFQTAIIELFPKNYHAFVRGKGRSFDLYENLRCGLIHAILPKSDIELIQEAEIFKFGEHLEIKEIRKRKRLILVSQTFYKDFENACKKIIDKIENHLISHPNVYQEYLGTEP